MLLSKLHRRNQKKTSAPTFLSDFILGSQDGLVNVLGILLGVSAATSDVKIIFVAALAALGAESISMGAVAYTSTVARRKEYLKEVSIERLETEQVSETILGKLHNVLSGWGYQGSELDTMTNQIALNSKALQEFMLSFVLKIAPVEKGEARRSFLIVLSSTVFGSIVPLIPFFFVTSSTILPGVITSVILSGAVLFFIGAYEARTTVGSLWSGGLQMMVIGLSAGFAGYLIGHFVGAIST